MRKRANQGNGMGCAVCAYEGGMGWGGVGEHIPNGHHKCLSRLASGTYDPQFRFVAGVPSTHAQPATAFAPVRSPPMNVI